MNSYLLLLASMYVALLQLRGQGARDPADGFISLPLNSSNFVIHKPYELPVSERYMCVTNGVHKLWGYDYSSGVWQFEGHAYVPSGTTSACIMQVFGANRTDTATGLMLRVYNGALMVLYTTRLIEDDIYGRWLRVNVIHEVGTGLLKVFIDGDLKLAAKDRGGASHYFKCGVYAQNYSSYFMESLWKDVKVLKLPD